MFSWRLEMTWLMIRQNGVFNTWISIIKELEFDRRVIDVFLYYGLGWKMYWTSILALQLLTFSDTECTKVWIPSEKLLRFFIRFFHVKLTDFPSSIFHTFFLTWFGNLARCLKITEKSEANYVYTLSGQKFIKSAKNGPFLRVFEKLKFAVKQGYQTGILIGKKLVENAHIQKFKCDILGYFQTLCGLETLH